MAPSRIINDDKSFCRHKLLFSAVVGEFLVNTIQSSMKFEKGMSVIDKEPSVIRIRSFSFDVGLLNNQIDEYRHPLNQCFSTFLADT